MLVIGETDPAAINKRFAHLPHGELAFDIGANCGQSVRRFLPNFDRVVAVEPADESFEVLRDEYGSDERVVLIQAACTSAPGPVTLDVRDIIGTGQLTTGPVGELPWGTMLGSREVTGITVDQLTDTHGAPDVLKVDTEGHETFVLQGSTATLGSHPYVLIEIHSRPNGEACHDLLTAAGYNSLDIIAHDAARAGSWAAHNHYWLAGT
jgi:FkbM family methyltransferase